MSAVPATPRQGISDKYLYYFLTLLSHILFGLQPVFSRYLQKKGIPTMSLLCMGFMTVVALYIPKIIYKTYQWLQSWVKSEGFNTKSISRAVTVFYTDFILNWKMHMVVISIVLRYGTTFYSSGYTSAVYVQLIGLLSPFFISYTNYLFLRNTPDGKMDSLNWRTFIALLFTIAGSVLIILGGIRTGQPGLDAKWWHFMTNFDMNWHNLGSNLTYRDFIGMILALMSTIFISIYMVMTRLCTTDTTCKSAAWLTSGENFMILQNAATAFIFIGPSLQLEDWSAWLRLSTMDWFVFFTNSFLVTLVATLSSIMAIQKLGPATVGSTTSARMVSAIVFSTLMLGETLQSAWQVVGSAVVLVSVTLFLYWQRKQHQLYMLEKDFVLKVLNLSKKNRKDNVKKHK
jgi:drug/metabolite transporter (DMT)-like permease